MQSWTLSHGIAGFWIQTSCFTLDNYNRLLFFFPLLTTFFPLLICPSLVFEKLYFPQAHKTFQSFLLLNTSNLNIFLTLKIQTIQNMTFSQLISFLFHWKIETAILSKSHFVLNLVFYMNYFISFLFFIWEYWSLSMDE